MNDPTQESAPSIPLDQLETGIAARILSLSAPAGGPLANRLLDLGFVPNTPVRVLRRAPLSDPIAFEIRGSRICLRCHEAREVQVIVESKT